MTREQWLTKHIDAALVNGGIERLNNDLAAASDSLQEHEMLIREAAIQICRRVQYPDIAYVLHECFNCLVWNPMRCH